MSQRQGGKIVFIRMILKITIAILLAGVVAAAQENPPPQKGEPFRLAPGDFRWVPFTVRQTPEEVDCHFDVVQGNPTVHLELLPISQFRLFDRGLEHDTLVVTPDSRTGDFRRIIDVSGQYAVVVVNEKRAPAVTVALRVETSINPDAGDVARTLSPRRRLTVILISFAFFFITVTWSARKLLRAAQ
jgi:hypothetical protein